MKLLHFPSREKYSVKLKVNFFLFYLLSVFVIVHAEVLQSTWSLRRTPPHTLQRRMVRCLTMYVSVILVLFEYYYFYLLVQLYILSFHFNYNLF